MERGHGSTGRPGQAEGTVTKGRQRQILRPLWGLLIASPVGLFLLWDGLTLGAAQALNLILRRGGLPALLETWSAIGFLAGLVGMMGFLGGASGAYTGQRWFAETVTRESSMERFRRWRQERERSIDQTTLLLGFGVQVMILAGLGSYLLGRI